MANIEIGGRLHSTATGNVVTGANEVFDDIQNKKQQDINAELIEAVGTGGSMDSRIAEAVNVEKERAEGVESALDGRVDTLEEAIGTGGSVDSRISAALNALDSSKSQSAGADGLALSVVEENGKITSISGSIASNTYDAYGAAATEATRAENAESALGGRVTTLETAVGSGGSVDSRISAAVTTETTRAQGAESTLQTNIAAEATRAQIAEEQLRQTYEALSQSQPIPVTELPATGEAGKIYRLAGTTSYADYMYAEGALTIPIKMAEYDNAIDDEPTAESNNLVKSGGAYKTFKYDLVYKKICNEYNSSLNRVVEKVSVIGVKKYAVVLENTVIPQGNYLAIRLMDTTNINYWSSSSHYIRTIFNYGYKDDVFEFELTDEELLSVKSIMVGLRDAETEQPACSFTLTVYNASNEALYNNIKKLRDNVLDISTNYRLIYRTTYNTFDRDNRVAAFADLVQGVTKYLVIVKDIFASNGSDIIVSLRNGKYSANANILGEGVSLTKDGYAIIENDGTYPTATCIGIVQHVFDESSERQCQFTASVYAYTGIGSVEDILNSIEGVEYLKSLLPITSQSIKDGTITEDKIDSSYKSLIQYYCIENVVSQYYTDNRAKVKVATIGKSKYHISVTNIVGIGNDNPLAIRLYSSKNITLWGSAYIVRQLGVFYSSANIDMDVELSSEELLQVQAIGVGMRDAKEQQPECSFNVAVYANDDNTILKQTRLNTFEINGVKNNIGDMSSLETENKTSVVGAINEIMENGISPKDDIPWNDEVYIASKAAFVRLYNPYKDKGSNVYMGQLHSHKQTMSYADFFTAHKSNGYSFIASIDYDRVRILENNPVAADIPSDFLYLCNGYEANCGAGVGQNGEHIIVLNAKDVVGFDELTQMSFPSPESVADVKSVLVENGCIAQLAHPYWNTLYQTPAKIATLKNDLRFVEIYSGLNDFNNNKQSGVEWDYALDILLSQGNFVFGTAVSDVHAETSSVSSTIIKMGAVKVFSNSLSRSEIFNALINGKYYSVSHTTKSLTDVSFNDGAFLINVGEANATVEFIGKDAEVLSTVTTTSENMVASYQLTGNEEMYVRARITFSDSKLAWTQAIMLDNKIL